jgi:hypothetical protein
MVRIRATAHARTVRVLSQDETGWEVERGNRDRERPAQPQPPVARSRARFPLVELAVLVALAMLVGGLDPAGWRNSPPETGAAGALATAPLARPAVAPPRTSLLAPLAASPGEQIDILVTGGGEGSQRLGQCGTVELRFDDRPVAHTVQQIVAEPQALVAARTIVTLTVPDTTPGPHIIELHAPGPGETTCAGDSSPAPEGRITATSISIESGVD